MAQRWIAAVCLHGEQGFRRIKGYASIDGVIKRIENEQAADINLPKRHKIVGSHCTSFN